MQTQDRDLEDPTQTCVYIPPYGGEDDDGSPSQLYTPEQWRDLPDGFQIRLQSYRAAWSKCLNRVQSIVHALHRPVAEAVVRHVRSAHIDVLPCIPHSELPVVAITGGDHSLYAEIIQHLNMQTADADDSALLDSHLDMDTQPRPSMMIHLHPADCPNLASMMKAIVTNFVYQDDSSDLPVKRRPAASLASYDINMLRAWYDSQERVQSLVIFLHDFEQLDAAVVQDALYICSLHAEHLPLTFILGMNSPPTPSYLHSTYPRSTLSLLRVETVNAPSGRDVVEEVIMKTFFDPDFEPDIMLGPGVFDFLIDFATRHTASLDAVITILQLAYMKHFTEPLTALAHPDLGTPNEDAARVKLQRADSKPFFDALRARLTHACARPSDSNFEDDDSFVAVQAAHDAWRERARKVRVGLAVAQIVREHGLGRGNRDGEREEDATALEFVSRVLRGRSARDVKWLGMVFKKLTGLRLRAVLAALVAFFRMLNERSPKYENIPIHMESSLAQLPDIDSRSSVESGREEMLDPVGRDPEVVRVSEALSVWLVTFLEQHLVRLDEGVLWDLWYTGSSPLPSELINPAPRATVVAGLSYPHDFIHMHDRLLRAHVRAADTLHHARASTSPMLDASEDEDNARVPPLRELPDTSILFRLYMEAGRMVNAYDWFQAFAVVLESQRRQLKRRARSTENERDAASKTPTRVNRYGVPKVDGRSKSREDDTSDGELTEQENGRNTVDEEDEEVDGDEDEEEVEEWRVEVHARFIRALHELDHMGFVKHTGRKADHVIRTVHDVLD
ncbi:hypothetical protein WOLCODRAFT_134564 [Wolfiporia cocos MD-104 SS10]|uniref:Uncharacterized protein n=1 Tax=Wolfiporia cocos (strain MD-104) TaxID=742152 RepID=A0A2H3JLH9_WOLCO|nr:hypothetical protein WOLCODRAFT_134564 [Wolfiporia cocos MD-104 SS10]